MGGPCAAHESVSVSQKINLQTPLLAAEAFMILEIQIQQARSGVNPYVYSHKADWMGEFP